jgi:hypothetical protein
MRNANDDVGGDAMAAAGKDPVGRGNRRALRGVSPVQRRGQFGRPAKPVTVVETLSEFIAVSLRLGVVVPVPVAARLTGRSRQALYAAVSRRRLTRVIYSGQAMVGLGEIGEELGAGC